MFVVKRIPPLQAIAAVDLGALSHDELDHIKEPHAVGHVEGSAAVIVTEVETHGRCGPEQGGC